MTTRVPLPFTRGSVFNSYDQAPVLWLSVARVISAEAGLWSSYPVARILREYEPDPSFDEGKAKRPRSSLTTLTVTVEPAFFALTTTPPIAPSSAELTCPSSAAELWAEAGAGWPAAKAKAIAAVGKKAPFFGGFPFVRLPPPPPFFSFFPAPLPPPPSAFNF